VSEFAEICTGTNFVRREGGGGRERGREGEGEGEGEGRGEGERRGGEDTCLSKGRENGNPDGPFFALNRLLGPTPP
jgi:hypothetical protein